MKEIVIQIPIYKTAVLIYWGNRKGLYKAVKRNSDKATAREVIEEVAPDTEGVTVTTSGRTVTIYLVSPPQDAQSVALLIHELSHATNFILREAGIPHTEDTEEAYTYLLEYLTRETLNRIYKQPQYQYERQHTTLHRATNNTARGKQRATRGATS